VTAVQRRRSKRFSWGLVDRTVTRALLVALYEASGQQEDVAKLRGLSDEALASQATRSMKTPPRPARLEELANVLMDKWLPTLAVRDLRSLAHVVQLGLTGPDRRLELRTRAELIDFFERRNLTQTMRVNLRKEFVRLHKAEVDPKTRSRSGGPRRTGEVSLKGTGDVDQKKPFPHQQEAWQALDNLHSRRDADRSGLIVLPTGAGKTYTMVAWLLRQMALDPELRVLWIADQQELVDQAARTFQVQARTMPIGIARSLRSIHGGANHPTALGDPHLDVACITRQSLLGRGFEATAQRRLAEFLSRPTMVVVDEAHHAVAPTYRKMLEAVRVSANRTLLVGLTATPWPAGYGMTALLKKTFPERIADVQLRDLIIDGILARPVFHTVETGESVSLTQTELSQIAGGDVPPSVLRGLDRNRRNGLIVNTWLGRSEEWGKTLVFACDIQHADNLHALFTSGGVSATVVHSESEARREDVLRDFRASQGPAVLISVGMLLEGVDVPDARTALLTRPTKSRILMRQMIGRVLRGPAGGGDEIAHVVDLRDRWTDDIDVLAPVDIPGIPAERQTEDEVRGDHRLPPVLDELTSEPLAEDVLRRIERLYLDLAPLLPHSAAMVSTELTGYFDLDHVNVPVFKHVRDRWQELIGTEVDGRSTTVRSPVTLFEDLPVPRPSKADVQEVVDYCRSRGFAPPLREVRCTFSVRNVAKDLLNAGALTETEKVLMLHRCYESSLARSAFFTFQAFYEAVQQEVLSLSGVTNNYADPETPHGGGVAKGLPRLMKESDRQLEPLVLDTIAEGRRLLASEADYAGFLDREYLPRVTWTVRPLKETWAFWGAKMHGQRRGEPEIRINRQLQAHRTQVSDELLRYLIWHELCHHVLPGRGHDAEFRRLEAMWPEAGRLDHELDTLHERFDLGWD
jgi:superfamily II DNA or RNA helicase